MTRRNLLLISLAVALGLAAVVMIATAVTDAQAWSKAETVCRSETTAADALAIAASIDGDHPAARDAVACVCVRTDGSPDCIARLDDLLGRPAHDDWSPDPQLTALWLEHLLTSGDPARGHARAARLFTADDVEPAVLATALSALLASGMPGPDAERLVSRVASSAVVRLVLADVFMSRREPAAAERLLAGAPPSAELQASWFTLRARARAARGDAGGAEDALDEWVRSGEDEGIVMGHRLLILAGEQLSQPRGRSLRDAFEQAIAASTARGDQPMLATLYKRYVSALVNGGLADEAVAVFERARIAGVPPPSMTPELLRRSASVATAKPGGDAKTELVRFQLRLKGAPPGATLWVAHGDDDVDMPYRQVADGDVVPSLAPLRYVVRAGDGGLLTSGRVWNERDVGSTTAEIDASTVDPAVPATTVPPLRSRPADGRARLFVVLLDCGDWRVTRQLIERGELPVLASLQERGRRAVLWSEPAYTAEALDSLMFPSQSTRVSVPATFHKMGDELAGLASIGTNPWAGLDQFLPAREDFFSTVGASERTVVNLLFTLGGQAGGARSGAVTGPRGQQGTRPLGVLERPLRPDERERHPLVADDRYLGPIAAEFDLLEDEAEHGSIDVVVMRIEALDLISHRSFVELTASGTADSTLTLNAAYRYIDERLGRLGARLDADDTLVVMSDHGIATGLKHDPRAMWIVHGPQVEPGRVAGLPAFRGVPAALADLLGLKTAWPETGLSRVATPSGPPTSPPAAPR